MHADELLLQKYFDGEASDEESRKAQALLAEDGALASDFEVRSQIGAVMREALTQEAESVDYDAMWASIEKGVAWHTQGHERALTASAERLGVKDGDYSWRDSIKKLFGWRMLSGVAAAALVLMLVPNLDEFFGPPRDDGRVGPVGTTDVVADASGLNFEGIEVESIEGSDSTSVMVLQGGDGASTIIWVSELDLGDGDQAI